MNNMILDYDEFKELSGKEKLQALLRCWGFEKGIFYGKVDRAMGEEGKFTFIRDLKNVNGQMIRNPFSGEWINSVFCGTSKFSELGIEEGDMVMFPLTNAMDKKEKNIVRVNERRLRKMIINDAFLENAENVSQEIQRIIDEKLEPQIISNIEEMNNKFLKQNFLYKVYTVDNFEEQINKMLKVKEDDFNNKKNQYNKEKLEITNKIEALQNESESIGLQINDKKSKLESLKDEIKNVEKNRERYIKLGLLKEDKKVRERNKAEKSNQEIIKHISDYLLRRKNNPLMYKQEIIEQFFIGIATKQIVILGGAPGSGKTSLVEGAAEAIGAECMMVPIRPNYSDSEDLLGYYNSIEKCYVSTPFLDALIEAGSNPEQLYFICLDEMNLAEAEHYFSEFLSTLYTKDKELKLYSTDIYTAEIDMINRLFQGENEEEIIERIGIKEYSELAKRIKNLDKYKPIVRIPDNVRFIGTINRDATTKDLSPKVIDRSIIININSSFDTFEELMKLGNEDEIAPIFVGSEDLRYGEINEAETYELFKDLIKLFNENEMELNFRFLKYAAAMLKVDGVDKGNIKDYIIAGKVLPKVNKEVSEDDGLLVRIDDIVSQNPVSRAIYDEMKRFYDNNNGILTYWR